MVVGAPVTACANFVWVSGQLAYSRCGEGMGVIEPVGGEVVRERSDLFLDVSDEGVAAPAIGDHDGEWGGWGLQERRRP